MFTEVFKLIWKNLISRSIMVLAVVLIVAALIFKGHMSIYNFFHEIYVGQMFYDPSSYQKGPYGFTENPKKAQKLFTEGFKKVVKLASNIYKDDYVDDFQEEKFSHDVSYEKFTNSHNIELVYKLFHDMELFCIPYVETNYTSMDDRLDKRNTVERNSDSNLIQYAIKQDDYKSYRDYLLDIDANYFFIASQKKPDSIPLINLRKQLLKSTCKTTQISVEMTTAVAYMEYAAEKQVYQSFEGNDANYIQELTFENLSKNKKYAKLLKEQFLQSYFITNNMVEKIKQSYNYYILQQDDLYFETYIKSILELSFLSGLDQNRKILKTLKTMETKKIKNKFSYLYALAEVSFRSRYYDETLSDLDLIRKSYRLEGNDYYKVQRLYFLIHLLRAG